MIDHQYFYTPHDLIQRDIGQLVLRGDEYHHCVHVLRKRSGDQFYVVDGGGLECRVTAVNDTSSELLCRIDDVRERPRELSKPLILIQALLKKDKMEWIAEKATELGVTRIIPVMTRRTDVSAKTFHRDRLAKILMSAMKQSMRCVLTVVDDVRLLADVVSEFPFAYVAHEKADSPITAIVPSGHPPVLVVGPEGGFTDDEVVSMQAVSWSLVSLGNRRLRAETAALAGLSHLMLSAKV